jgi:lysophospholipase L1-like esterase
MPLRHFHRRVAEKSADRSAAPVLIVALGDSVTQGCMELGRYDFEGVYHAQLKRLLERRWPETTFSVINAGVWGESSPQALSRLDRDVIRHQPDLTLVAFGLNDACELGRERIGEFEHSITRIIQRTRGETSSDVLLMTPPMMTTRDNDRVHAEHRQFVETIVKAQTSGVLRDFAQKLREIGQALRVPVADVHAEWEAMAARGVDTSTLLANGLNHPNAEMHHLAAQTIFNIIHCSRAE